MNNTYIAILSAASALLGTIIGGIISYFTTRYTVTNQHQHNQRTREIDNRESLYSDFLAEVTRLGLLAIEKKPNEASDFSRLAALQARIKLLASSDVASAAGIMTAFTIKKFSNPKEVVGDVQSKKEAEESPLKFIELAKKELDALKRKA